MGYQNRSVNHSTSDKVNRLLSAPRKNLEYFATTYAKIEAQQALAMTDLELVRSIQNSNMLSRVISIYDEAVRDVEKCKEKYNFYVVEEDERKPILSDEVLSDLDENHLFGKAVFVLLTHLGNMEADDIMYAAEKKAA